MNHFTQPLRIGTLQLKNRVFLAPLAGVSDAPFRRICQEFGAGLTYVEMLTAKAIIYKSKRTFDMRRRHPSEDVLGVQITGSSPEEIVEAIGYLDCENYDTIDINMGCPVKKVIKNNCGSAILKTPEMVLAITQAARTATTRPLSVKLRLGFTLKQINIQENIAKVVQGGANMVTIHGRTRDDDYSARVDYSGIHSGIQTCRKQAKGHSVITVGNGGHFLF